MASAFNRLSPRQKRRAQHLFGQAGTPRIAIIGGGIGGIGLAVRLRQAGVSSFTLFEKNDRPGGTWWENRYPGAQVDSPSHLYSLSFKRYDWSRNYANQPELLRYMHDIVDENDLHRHFCFDTQIESVVWNERSHTYRLQAIDGRTFNAHVVVSAVGLLNAINYPTWPGLETFEGPKFHTARWEDEHDLNGKRVAIVGTGCTAAQIVPEIASRVGKLYLFQREPGHVFKKGVRSFTEQERAKLSRPLAYRMKRIRCFLETAKVRGPSPSIPGTRLNKLFGEMAIEYIQEVFKDRPDLAELVTPKYPFAGKRIILSDDFYPSLLRKNVELIPKAVSRVTPHGVVDSDGVEREIDVLVMATGFQPANFLANLEVTGRGGQTIHEYWNGEPRAVMGTAVARFPNFYMLYGPNSNGGEILFHEEQQVGFIMRSIKRMIRRGVSSVEMRESVMNAFNRWLQGRLRDGAYGHSEFGLKLGYYRSPTGAVVTQWSQGAILFWLMSQVLSRVALVSAVTNRPAGDLGEFVTEASVRV